MSVKDLIDQCQHLGVSLSPGSPGKLRIRPKGVLPPALKTTVQRYKYQILRLLTAPPPPEHGCDTCQRRSFWQHAESFKWICATCHPASHPKLIEAIHEAAEPAMPWIGIGGRPCKL
jgi:TubC N-terminal docking domain